MKKTSLKLYIGLLPLLWLAACTGGTKHRIVYEPVSVNIPAEFEQNEEARMLIHNYQDLVNDFNCLALQMMEVAGVDAEHPNIHISEKNLSSHQMLKMARLGTKQMKLSESQDQLRSQMASMLPALPENEQRALLGVIGFIDSRMGVFSSQSHAIAEQGFNEHEMKVQYYAEPEVLSYEDSLYLVQIREAGDFHAEESGQWNEPENSMMKEIFQTLLWFAFFGIFVFIFFRKGRKRRSRSSFLQRLSHMSGEIRGNFNKIPIEEMKNDPNIPEKERQGLEIGEKFIMGIIDGNPSSKANGSQEPEEAGKIVAHTSLKDIYHSELKNSLSDIENARKSIARLFILTLVVFVFGLLSFGIVGSSYSLNIITGILSLLVAVALFVRSILRFLKFRSRYKTEVVEKIVRLINPKYIYDPNKHISLDDFNRSGIIPEIANKCQGDDHVCGKIDKTVFEFSEFVAQNEYEVSDKDGKKSTRVDNLFNGLFFFADFHKHIQAETFVRPDKAERLLGKFGQRFQRSAKGKLVKLENPEFEKYFAVFSTSQTEARYILTPAMMEGLVNLRKQIGRDFHLSFIGERVYCGIAFNKALFEASVFRQVRFADIEFMHSLFSLIETIISEMNLNTRIWTKA